MLPAERRVQRGVGKGIVKRTDPSFSVVTALVGKHLCELPVVKRKAENKARKSLPQKNRSGECSVICCSNFLKLEALGVLQSTGKGVFVQKIQPFILPRCTQKGPEEGKAVAKEGAQCRPVPGPPQCQAGEPGSFLHGFCSS